MSGYTRDEVKRLLRLSESELRGLLRGGLIVPQDRPGRARFSFQDLVVLRAALELRRAAVPMRRIRRALLALREQLPRGAALSQVHIAALGDELVVRDAGALYAPTSGQLLFDFGVGEIRARVEPLAKRALAAAARDRSLDAAGWYSLALDLDEGSPTQAQDAYQRALALDPAHLDAHVNLGRLLHQAGHLDGAASHYRQALAIAPTHAVASFNLGVVLEDLGQLSAAAQAYQQALSSDPAQADAHHNLGHLLDRLGQPAAALRHLAAYRRLSRER